MNPAAEKHPSLKVALGAGESGAFDTGLPVLAGEAVENLFGSTRSTGHLGALTLFQTDGWLLGAATLPLSAGLEYSTQQLYGNIFQAAQGWHLARIWNYVPAINEAGPAELENYSDVLPGRSLAFEQHFGRDFNARLPSASAVGHQRPLAYRRLRRELGPTPPCGESAAGPAYDYPENTDRARRALPGRP